MESQYHHATPEGQQGENTLRTVESIIEAPLILKKGAIPMTYKNCQSCGMPLSKDPQGGGTEANGSRSTMYCSHCYQQGKFTLPDITVDQMADRVKEKMKEMHIPGFLAYFMTKNLPKLKRWAG